MTTEAADQYEIGQAHYYGEDASQDYAEAAKWFHLAADQGHADAQYSLGYVYEYSSAIQGGEEEAKHWYQLAAEQGHSRAQHRLGELTYGDGHAEALNWLQTAAEQGLAGAMYELARLYRHREISQLDDFSGVPLDFTKAAKWFLQAAEQGHASAMGFLSEIYERGEGVSLDEEEAVKWMRKAADHGDAEAMGSLGRMYKEGNCVPQDLTEAVYWLRKAVENGFEESAEEFFDLASYFPDTKSKRGVKSDLYFWRLLVWHFFEGDVEPEDQEMLNLLNSQLSKKKRSDTEKRVWKMYQMLSENKVDPLTKILGEKDGPLGHHFHVSDEDWIKLPSGEFTMGEGKFKRTFTREHLVEIDAFEMMKTPVTFAMFDAYCVAENKKMPDDEGWGRGCQPVINVSYWDAVDYVNWLNGKTGWNCRLPTEAEWEYACRAGSTKPFWSGASINNDKANFYDPRRYRPELYWQAGWERKKTMPVDFYAPNPWGLYDMTGNVYEMCASLYDEEYTGKECQDATEERNIQPKIAAQRVIRGGCWRSELGELRSAARANSDPGGCSDSQGFRLARDLP